MQLIHPDDKRPTQARTTAPTPIHPHGATATKAVAACLVVVLVAMIGYRALWANIDVKMSGWYSVDVLEEVEEFERVEARMNRRPKLRLGLEPHYVTVSVMWRAYERVHWPATRCDFHALIAHPTGNPAGTTSERFLYSHPSEMGAAIRKYPDIPTRVVGVGQRDFAGSIFSIESRMIRPQLTVLFFSSEDPLTARDIRAGVLFTCEGRAIRFAWLQAQAAG